MTTRRTGPGSLEFTAFWLLTAVALAWFWHGAWVLVGQPLVAHFAALIAALTP